MIRPLLSAALLSLAVAMPARGQAEDADKGKETKPVPPKKVEPAKPKAPASLPEGVLNFYGKVTGTVESVEAEKGYLKVKVASAQADSEKNKATKPESLAGLTIQVTPLAKKGEGDKAIPDEAAMAYIKGAKPGDPVTLDVRASKEGVVFRLLKVPTAAAK